MALGPASGGGGQAGDVRAGGAFVEISAKDALSKTLLTLKAKAAAFAAGLNVLGRNVTFVGAAAFAPLAGFFKTGLNRAEEVEKLAEDLGYTAEQFQRLKYAADVAGVSIEKIAERPDKFRDLTNAAPIMDAKTIREAVQAQRQFRAAIIDLQTALAPLVSAITPFVSAVAQFVKRNPELARVLFAFGAAAAVVGPALLFVGSVAIPAVVTAAGVLVGILTGVVGKVIAVSAAVGYLGSRAFPETARAARQSFGEMLSIATDTVGGIVTAIGKGDFALAMDLAGAGMLAAWKRLEAQMTYVWVRVKNTILDTFRDAIAGVKLMINDLSAWILRNDFTGLLSGDMTDDDINAARDQIANDIVTDRAKAQNEARAFRDQQIAAANQEADAARAKLNELLARVNQAAPDEPGGGVGGRISSTRSAFRVLNTGTQQFGGSSIDSEQLMNLQRIAKDGKIAADELKKLNDSIEKLMRLR